MHSTTLRIKKYYENIINLEEKLSKVFIANCLETYLKFAFKITIYTLINLPPYIKCAVRQYSCVSEFRQICKMKFNLRR